MTGYMLSRCLGAFIFLSIELLGCRAVQAADKDRLFAPIVVSPGSKTWLDLQAMNQAWAERTLLAPFRVRTAGQPWAADAAEFVERAVGYLVPSPDEQFPPATLVRTSQRLLKEGCRDPLFLFLEMRVAQLDRDSGGYGVYSRDALATALKLRGPKALAWLIARDMASKNTYPLSEGENARYDWAADLGRQALVDGSYLEEEDALFLAHLFPAKPDHFADSRDRLMSLAAKVESDEWLRQILLGRAEWAAAQSGEDESSAKEDEPHHLALAGEALERAWQLRPDRPEAAAIMEEVAFRRDPRSADSRVWFDRAIAAQFDYAPAYRTMLEHCLPHHGGSIAQVLDFGDACRATERYDTMVPQLYFSAVREAGNVAGDWKTIYRQTEVAHALIEVSRGVVEAPTRQEARKQHLDLYAVNCYLAGQLSLAANLRRQNQGTMCAAAVSKLRQYRAFDFDQMVKGYSFDAAVRQAGAAELQAAGSFVAAQELWQESAPVEER